jgi:hypothetical protein
MNTLYLRRTVVAAAGFLLVASSFGQNVQVTFNLTAVGAPASLYDTYIIFYEGEEGQGGAYDGPYSPQNGQIITVPDPGMFGATVYDYAVIGLYNDSSGATHVALGTANDLSGDSWDSLFTSAVTEASVITSLEDGSNLAAMVLEENRLGDLGGTEIVTSAGGSAYITGFSNGVNIGTLYSQIQSAPEPSTLAALGLLPLGLLFRRRA